MIRRLALLGLLLAAVAVTLALTLRNPSGPSKSGVTFVDVARAAGIDHRIASEAPDPSQALTILETMGNGGAFLDFDGDGKLDVLIVDRPVRLYRGDGKGHFQDATPLLGLEKSRDHFMGCAVGDYDNDGFDDLYLSGFKTGRLLHNERGKRFRDATASAGMKPQPWGTSCGFFDADNDGLLDLFIANYVEFGTDERRYTQRCEPLACGPNRYNAERPTLYRNVGAGRFTDATKGSGLLDTEGKGLAIGFSDIDGDGDTDILVANDQVAADLFQNEDGHFLNVAKPAGTAYQIDGKAQGGMGVDWADYDGDGRLDAIVTNYTEQPRSLYRNEENLYFTNETEATGIATPTRPFLAFGVKWLDYDNDGWPDLLIANGNVDNKIAILEPKNAYRQPMQAFRNTGARGGRAAFVDESRALGPAIRRPIVGRGLATGDYDNDGRIDALVIDDDGPVLLLHNQGGAVGNWIGLSLVGTGGSNRNALGARVTLASGGRTQVAEVQSAGSYLSASDRRLHFGLGKADAASATVRWPDGRRETFANLKAGLYHKLVEGGATRP